MMEVPDLLSSQFYVDSVALQIIKYNYNNKDETVDLNARDFSYVSITFKLRDIKEIPMLI